MRLDKLMNISIFSVAPDDSLDKAICLMDEHHIHHLPVLEGTHLVGMLSDRDLLISVGWKLECERRTSPKEHVVGPMRVGDIMSKPVLYLSPENEVHSAAHLMAAGKFHAMPIVAGRRLLGMVTSTDLLMAYCEQRSHATVNPLLRDEVRTHMLTNLVTIGPKKSLHNAARIMHEAQIRHLPVTSGNTLIGIVTDRDVRRAYGTEMIEDEKAQAIGQFYMGMTAVLAIMTPRPHSILEETLIVDAIAKMVEHRIGSLPVTRHGDELVGLITDTDVLRLIAEAEGCCGA
jgi:CBS domain-containing protein